MMVGEQYISTTTEGSSGPRPVPEHIHKIGIYGWRKRCLYLFVLLLVVMLVVNLAFTVWIFRVMWFNPEGMGLLQVHSDGVKLEDGGSEFLLPLYTQEIHSREDSPLLVHSETENVSLNARDESGNVTGRTSVGPKQAEGHAANVLLSSQNDNMLFSADGKQAAIGPDKLRITGWSLPLARSVWTRQRAFTSKPWRETSKLRPTWTLSCSPAWDCWCWIQRRCACPVCPKVKEEFQATFRVSTRSASVPVEKSSCPRRASHPLAVTIRSAKILLLYFYVGVELLPAGGVLAGGHHVVMAGQ
ncbi:gamma-sarcoglycan isoform X3 [Dunckerocampus dactyliophorus]|nr:gamma-sarcoglycan isoform X3 [Dunckerocampus dactyliophorus]